MTAVLEDTAALEHALRTRSPAAPETVGVWLAADHLVPRHLADDYRVGELVAIGWAIGDETWVVPSPSRVALQRLQAFFTERAAYLVFADAHDTLFRWARATGEPFSPKRFACVRTAAALLSEGRRPFRDLPVFDDLATRILGPSLPPTPLTAGREPAAVAARARAVLSVMEKLTPRMRSRGLVPSHQLECQLVPAVIAMERTGMCVDGAAFERVAQAWQHERAHAHEPDRIARLDKLLSTYAYWPREYVRDGRIHARLHPLATDSGRFACSDPNLQQVPSDHTAPGLRACFRAPPGRRLIIADYAQIELRVAAHLAPCDALRGVFHDGRDPHRATAATISGKPETEITPHERQLAKAVNFGFLFGMGAERFRSYAQSSYGVTIDEAQARRAKDAFFATYPGIARWHDRVGALGRRKESVVVRTALGRRKRFAAGKFSFNAALNIPVQGTAAEGFKRAMIALHDALPRFEASGVLCVHDEYLAEVPALHAEASRALVEQLMREAMGAIVTSVPIEVTAHVAQSWAAK